MSVAIVSHPACAKHDMGPGQPEQPARLSAVLGALNRPEFATLMRIEAPRAHMTDLLRVHTEAYLDAIVNAAPTGPELVTLDSDTRMNNGSLDAALRAAGGAIAAVNAVMERKARHAFAAVRPPGHHAEADEAMGFCIFNNVAVAAAHARVHWSVKRIAVADFDVHHGNGTQSAFWDDPDLLFASTHQSPCYPGTGARSETGAANNIVNRPLPPGAGSAEFRAAWEEILTRLAEFSPDLLLISAGFDAHYADPLAQLELDDGDFGWIGEKLSRITKRGTVSTLEGGYDLTALANSSAAYIRALMEEDASHA